jgi:hypothetical protein
VGKEEIDETKRMAKDLDYHFEGEKKKKCKSWVFEGFQGNGIDSLTERLPPPPSN